MKLFSKYTRINLVATIIIFLLASGAFYYLISYIVIDQVDDDLKIEQREIETFIKVHNAVPEPVLVRDQKITYTPLQQPYNKIQYTTLPLFDSIENKKKVFRELLFGIYANKTWYQVAVAKSLDDSADLIHSILYITFATILLILLATFIMNRILLKRLWKPFYDTLSAIKNFKVGKKQDGVFQKTEIEEFTLMNKILEKTTTQAQIDYFILKEFTENASHEMQTPLAIIRSKLDLLIQDEYLSEKQSKTVQSAYSAIQKLSRLNQSLLLLTKIENQQFEEITTVNFNKKIEEKVEAFHELWQTENISISVSLKDAFIEMNNQLADILLNNLLSNATHHNFTNGDIDIELNKTQLRVTNSSLNPPLDKFRLFTRFYKNLESTEHNGLGLSIMKQICEVSGFNIDYSFHTNHHSFTIVWKPRQILIK
jgi:signal transduction histidine kinase